MRYYAYKINTLHRTELNSNPSSSLAVLLRLRYLARSRLILENKEFHRHNTDTHIKDISRIGIGYIQSGSNHSAITSTTQAPVIARSRPR